MVKRVQFEAELRSENDYARNPHSLIHENNTRFFDFSGLTPQHRIAQMLVWFAVVCLTGLLILIVCHIVVMSMYILCSVIVFLFICEVRCVREHPRKQKHHKNKAKTSASRKKPSENCKRNEVEFESYEMYALTINICNSSRNDIMYSDCPVVSLETIENHFKDVLGLDPENFIFRQHGKAIHGDTAISLPNLIRADVPLKGDIATANTCEKCLNALETLCSKHVFKVDDNVLILCRECHRKATNCDLCSEFKTNSNIVVDKSSKTITFLKKKNKQKPSMICIKCSKTLCDLITSSTPVDATNEAANSSDVCDLSDVFHNDRFTQMVIKSIYIVCSMIVCFYISDDVSQNDESDNQKQHVNERKVLNTGGKKSENVEQKEVESKNSDIYALAIKSRITCDLNTSSIPVDKTKETANSSDGADSYCKSDITTHDAVIQSKVDDELEDAHDDVCLRPGVFHNDSFTEMVIKSIYIVCSMIVCFYIVDDVSQNDESDNQKQHVNERKKVLNSAGEKSENVEQKEIVSENSNIYALTINICDSHKNDTMYSNSPVVSLESIKDHFHSVLGLNAENFVFRQHGKVIHRDVRLPTLIHADIPLKGGIAFANICEKCFEPVENIYYNQGYNTCGNCLNALKKQIADAESVKTEIQTKLNNAATCDGACNIPDSFCEVDNKQKIAQTVDELADTATEPKANQNTSQNERLQKPRNLKASKNSEQSCVIDNCINTGIKTRFYLKKALSNQVKNLSVYIKKERNSNKYVTSMCDHHLKLIGIADRSGQDKICGYCHLPKTQLCITPEGFECDQCKSGDQLNMLNDRITQIINETEKNCKEVNIGSLADKLSFLALMEIFKSIISELKQGKTCFLVSSYAFEFTKRFELLKKSICPDIVLPAIVFLLHQSQ